MNAETKPIVTDEEIRIAVAEAVGWSNIDKAFLIGRVPDGEPYCFWGNQHHEIPDYCNDLNAMAEAEKTLTEAQKCVYAETLCAILKSEVVDWGYYPGEATIEWHSIAVMVFATSKQRAEAFLRTIGKWKQD